MKDEIIISRRSATKLMGVGATSYLIDPTSLFTNQEKMNRRAIPNSNETLPVIGLGTWQTFDVGNTKLERDPLKEVLKVLIRGGGSVIDSSPMYGRSEKVVGDLTRDLQIKESIFEATKVWTQGKQEGEDQMNVSFNLMQVNQMDLMQIHNLMDWKTHLKTLRRWKDQNRIRYIGVTHYTESGYAELERVMTTEPIDFIQVNYNLAVRESAKRILPLAKDMGIAVLINRPYEGGSLFRVAKNTELPEWSHEFNANSWGQFFLKFILSNPAVTCVIPGTSKARHMLDNVQAGFGNLPNAQHKRKMINLMSA